MKLGDVVESDELVEMTGSGTDSCRGWHRPLDSVVGDVGEELSQQEEWHVPAPRRAASSTCSRNRKKARRLRHAGEEERGEKAEVKGTGGVWKLQGFSAL